MSVRWSDKSQVPVEERKAKLYSKFTAWY
jgi:hypothetical protein